MTPLRALVLVAVLSVAGCTGIPETIAEPEVRLTDIRLQPAGGIFEQPMLLVLTVRNPNDFDIPIDGLRFDLELNGRYFAQGLSDERTVIPRLGERRIAATASTNLVSMVRQMLTTAQNGALDYRIAGDAFIDGADGRTVPFETKGDVRLTPEPGVPI